jgi:hypothetical protein
MKTGTTLAVFAAAVAVVAGTAISQDRAKPNFNPNMSTGSQTPEMKAWEEAGKPTSHHEFLKSMVGTWDAEVTMWAAPNTPPSQSTGTMVATATFGGRFLTSSFSSSIEGQMFQGISTWGYNSIKRQYENTWIDNMSTAISYATGSYDQARKTFTLSGKMDDPFTGQSMTQKQVTTISSDTKMTFQVFTTGTDGKEHKNLEINYTRKAGMNGK